jgi:hypothetical protein
MKYRVRIEGVLYPYRDATQDITIKRELIDIWKGEPGKAGACMNQQCIIRNKRAFPHKVLAASVIKTRVFILETPKSAVRYILSAKDGQEIAQHDILASARPATLVLRAPRGSKIGGSRYRATGSGGHNPRGKGKPLAKGEQARLLAAVGAMKD